MLSVPKLPLSLFRLGFVARRSVQLPDYAGSAWRGAFGHALKRLVCVTREPACAQCLLVRSCVYPYIFETPPDPQVGKLRKYPAAPHPYVLRPLDHGPLEPGQGAGLELVLMGRGHNQLPYVVRALEQAGERGLGKGRGRLDLVTMEQAVDGDWLTVRDAQGRLQPYPARSPQVPPCPARVRLLLETPLRIKTDNRCVDQAHLGFGDLFGVLLRRISLLTAFHTDTPLETDFAALTRAAREVPVAGRSLHWRDWTRYSSRQGGAVKMGGLVGRLELDGAGLEPFWPYLWLGQWTHLGKGAVMGLGRYRVEGKL